jgi:hypothetical protein
VFELPGKEDGMSLDKKEWKAAQRIAWDDACMDYRIVCALRVIHLAPEFTYALDALTDYRRNQTPEGKAALLVAYTKLARGKTSTRKKLGYTPAGEIYTGLLRCLHATLHPSSTITTGETWCFLEAYDLSTQHSRDYFRESRVQHERDWQHAEHDRIFNEYHARWSKYTPDAAQAPDGNRAVVGMVQ